MVLWTWVCTHRYVSYRQLCVRTFASLHPTGGWELWEWYVVSVGIRPNGSDWPVLMWQAVFLRLWCRVRSVAQYI